MDIRTALVAGAIGFGTFFGALVMSFRNAPQSEVEVAPAPAPAPAPGPAVAAENIAPKAVPAGKVPAEKPVGDPAKKKAPERVGYWVLPKIVGEDGQIDIAGSWPKQIAIDASGERILLERGGAVSTFRVGQRTPTAVVKVPSSISTTLAPDAKSAIFETSSPERELLVYDDDGRKKFHYRPVEPQTRRYYSFTGRTFLNSGAKLLQAVEQSEFSTLHEIDLTTGQAKRDAKTYPKEIVDNMSLLAPIGMTGDVLVAFQGLGQDRCPDGLGLLTRGGPIERIAGVPGKELLKRNFNALHVSPSGRYAAFLDSSKKPQYEVWDWRNKRQIATSAGWSFSPVQCGFTPDGKYFWAVGMSNFERRGFGPKGHWQEGIPNCIRVRDLHSGLVCTTVSPAKLIGHEVRLLAISGNGKFVALVDSESMSVYRVEELFPDLVAD
jgi:hypothetical protein